MRGRSHCKSAEFLRVETYQSQRRPVLKHTAPYPLITLGILINKMTITLIELKTRH